ncbi:MAG: hypothetical protein HYV97_05315 [Bdellovibrio sp.]|nr:hypothetical protein [Bdellovibrio sp.]
MKLSKWWFLSVLLLSGVLIEASWAKGCPQVSGKTCKKGMYLSVKLNAEVKFDEVENSCLFSDVSCQPENCDHDHADCSGKISNEQRDSLIRFEKDFNQATVDSKAAKKKVDASTASGDAKEKSKTLLQYYVTQKKALEAVKNATKDLDQKTDGVNSAIKEQQSAINDKVKEYTVLLNTHGVPKPDEYIQKAIATYAKGTACTMEYEKTRTVVAYWDNENFDLNETQQRPDVYAKIKAAMLKCGYPENLDKAILILEERKALGATNVETDLEKLKKSKQNMEKLYTKAQETVNALKAACTSFCPKTKVDEAIEQMKTWLDGSEEYAVSDLQNKLMNECKLLPNLKIADLEAFDARLVEMDSKLLSKYSSKYKYCFGPEIDKAYEKHMKELKVILDGAQAAAKNLRMCGEDTKNGMGMNNDYHFKLSAFRNRLDTTISSIISRTGYAGKAVEKQWGVIKKRTRLCKVANDPNRIFGPPSDAGSSSSGDGGSIGR